MSGNVNKIHPAGFFIAVSPSDTANLVDQALKPITTRGISLAVSGDLAVKDGNGNTVVLKGLAAGIILPIVTNRIMATNTTASGICAYW